MYLCCYHRRSGKGNYQDNYYKEEEKVQSLTVHTAKLSDKQKEEWVSEMKDIGINF
jgi:hypothetical protein